MVKRNLNIFGNKYSTLQLDLNFFFDKGGRAIALVPVRCTVVYNALEDFSRRCTF